MRQIRLILLVIGMCTMTAHSQPRNMMREEQGEPPPFLFFEPVNLIGSDSSLSRLDIHYRIDQSFFVAVKNRDTSSTKNLISRGEILIELFDSLESSKARFLQKVEIGTDRSDHEPPGKSWYQGIASFDAPPGRYKIVFEVDDLESERRFIGDNSKVLLKRFGATSRETSTPLFVDGENIQSTPKTLTPIAFGPNLLFGRKAAIFVELPLTSDTVNGTRAEYRFSATSLVNRSSTVVLAETLTNLITLPKVRLSRAQSDDGGTYTVSSNDSSGALGLIIPVASEKLPLRRFEMTLTIKLGTTEFKATKSFQMVWPEMPSSLRDIDYAIDALKYITTEDQRDSLHTGDLDERRDKLEAFWKTKENTPETAYNEVMVEYYRRVDHASKTFGTLRDPDGFKSDRGRIYILYGPPTKTDRSLNPSTGYQEVWTYERTGKKFIFADQTKSGNYVLISTQSP
jgi:GWxTD domain-containing protein